MTCKNCSCDKAAGAPACPARAWLEPAEAAGIVGLRPVTIRKWCEAGLLGSKCGPGRGRWRIRLDDLKRVAGEEWCHDVPG